MVCLSGAVTVDILQKLWFRVLCLLKSKHLKIIRLSTGSHYLNSSLFIMVGTIIVSSILGISRIFALYRNYHAPLDLMMELNRFPLEGKLNSNNIVINVCIGKDWYRYPSSFFLPNNNWEIRFIQSEFRGILPAAYSELENGTAIIHKHFNDKNREEMSSYFDINRCHFLLDLDFGRETELEPIYSKQTDKWFVVKSLPFLNSENSNTFFRAFYIPFISDLYVSYGKFNLLQTTKISRLK